MPDAVRLSKGYDGMARLTTVDRLCCPRAMMACDARRRPTVCAAQGRLFHASPDVIQVGDVMPRPTLPTVCVVKGR